MAFSARGPCPCPSEMAVMVFILFTSSASLMSEVMGSAPGVRTKMSGVVQRDSSKHTWSTSWGGSMNLEPIWFATYSWISGMTTSGRMARVTHRTAKSLVVTGLVSSAISAAGVLESITSDQPLALFINTLSRKPSRPETPSSSSRSPQALSESQDPKGLGLGRSTAVAPVSKKRRWAGSRVPAPSMSLVQRRHENKSLSFSNKERQMLQ
mmetsp:Transcript_15464/g.36094  ORF Transcript_15464/g.36094 Transcript_15464/m.36094 type:complete len:210 (+) Transcript_15464:1742-2371(+)